MYFWNILTAAFLCLQHFMSISAAAGSFFGTAPKQWNLNGRPLAAHYYPINPARPIPRIQAKVAKTPQKRGVSDRQLQAFRTFLTLNPLLRSLICLSSNKSVLCGHEFMSYSDKTMADLFIDSIQGIREIQGNRYFF